MKNYFLLYRPFHFDYVNEIIKAKFQDNDNTLINHFGATYSVDKNYIHTKIINVPVSSFQRLMGVRKLIQELTSLANKNEEINIFIPHTLGVLANYSYYNLARKHKNVKINIFYEGVIVFYNYDHDYKENFTYYLSRLLTGLLIGAPYKIDKRLLYFDDQRIKKIYTPFLNIDAPKEKLIEVKLKKTDYLPSDDTCLVIGLMLEDRFKSETEKIVKAIYNKINQLGIKQVYIKDHPSDKCELFHSVAKEFKRELLIIDDKSPIENIIPKYKPKYIISSWSSALINLSESIPKTTSIFCVITESMIDTAESKKLANVYKDQNIEIIFA